VRILCGYCVFCFVINSARSIKISLFFLPTHIHSDALKQRQGKLMCIPSTATLHVQLDGITVKLALVLLERGLDLGGDELLDNLGRAANEAAGVGEAVDLGENGLEERRDLDALDQVVVLALLLDHGAGLVGEDADLLVGVLAGIALLDHGHDDVLGCHLRGFLVV
jgi:hypothetical protein